MKILVTGGCGYIGGHTVHQLLELGHDVTVLDDLSTGRIDNLVLSSDGCKFRLGDTADATRLDEVMGGNNFDVVMHFAACIDVNESIHNPMAYYQNNTANTISVIRACERHNINRLIYSSTAAVYGIIGDREFVAEECPTRPTNPYAQSKLMSERIIKDYIVARPQFGCIILRYFNVAGSGGRVGPGPKSRHLIRNACRTALGTQSYLQIFGTNYNTPDGSCIRDYIHVEDVARAHIDAMNYLKKGGTFDVFNCGYGKGLSVKEIVSAVKRVSGREIPIQIDLPREGDVAKVVANCSKIKRVLGWEPKHANIEEIIRSSLEWERDYAPVLAGV